MSFLTRIIDWVTTPYTIFLVFKDPAISTGVKWRAALGLAGIFIYIISPIDVIPDFVPFAGWLDDIIIVPLGFALLRLITPGMDIIEKRDTAQKGVRKVVFWTVISLVGAVLVVLAFFGLMIWIVIRLITG